MEVLIPFYVYVPRFAIALFRNALVSFGFLIYFYSRFYDYFSFVHLQKVKKKIKIKRKEEDGKEKRRKRKMHVCCCCCFQ